MIINPTLTNSKPTPDPLFQAHPVVNPDASAPLDVIVDISTAVLISNYYKYYDSPIQSFHPTYYALSDGSLVCPPLIQDLNEVHISLALSAATCAFFFMNIFTVTRFIRWGKVKDKCLFYVLLISQVFGPVAVFPYFIGVFNQHASCYVMEIITEVFSAVSQSLLITGISGFKAYRCLGNSRVVLFWLCTLRGLCLTLVVLDLSKLKAIRRLSGSCIRSSSPTFVVYSFMAQLFEMLFIACCFIYALWKLYREPGTNARVSISVAADPGARSLRRARQGTGRGWWDYVPKEPPTPGGISEIEAAPTNLSCISRIRLAWAKAWNTNDPKVPQQKPSPHTDYPTTHPIQATSLQHSSQATTPDIVSFWPDIQGCRGLRFFKIGPRLKVFAKVLRNELVFTAAIASMQLTVFVVSVIGMYKGTMAQGFCWFMVNWVLVSSLTSHSFRRVVRRHDQEFYQQQQVARHPIHHAVRDAYEEYPNHSNRTWPSTLSYRILRRSGPPLSPFGDPLSDFNLIPVRAHYNQQSGSSSGSRTVGTMVCQRPPERPLLDILSSTETPSPSPGTEIIHQDSLTVHNGSDVGPHRPIIAGGKASDCEPP